MLSVSFCSQKSRLAPGVRGTLIQIWMELFQEGRWLVLVQPCMFGNTGDHDSLNRERRFAQIKVATSLQDCSLAGGGGGPGAGASRLQSRHSFPGFVSNIAVFP